MVKQPSGTVESELSADNPVLFNSFRAKSQPQQISVGDLIPQVRLSIAREDNSTHYFNTQDVLKGRKVILITVPGAFTPVCTDKHLSSFFEHIDEIKKLGFDVICVCPNNRWVAKGWNELLRHRFPHVHGEVEFFPDWNGELIYHMGLGIDLSVGPNANTPVQLGFVAKRSAMIVENGIIKVLEIEKAPGVCEVTGALSLLTLAKKYA